MDALVLEEQFHYAAIGSVANLASRLCDEARSGQVLITESVYAKVDHLADTRRTGDLTLKGFPKPVPVLKVMALKEDLSDLQKRNIRPPGSERQTAVFVRLKADVQMPRFLLFQMTGCGRFQTIATQQSNPTFLLFTNDRFEYKAASQNITANGRYVESRRS